LVEAVEEEVEEGEEEEEEVVGQIWGNNIRDSDCLARTLTL